MTEPLILVVEDDRKTAELIRLYLEHEGYRVLWAADGRAALDMARQNQPDLIVLDLMLPVLGGVVAIAYQAIEPTPQVLGISAVVGLIIARQLWRALLGLFDREKLVTRWG